MELPNKDDKKFKDAKKRVDEIKGFYTHLIVYILVNLFLFIGATGLFENGFFDRMPDWGMLTTPFFWGIGLAFHGLYVFQFKSGFFKRWEERKIKEFMERDRKEAEKFKDYD